MNAETSTAELPEEPPYKVGFGKPPKEHQFKPGRSGNPSGRPKGLPRFDTTFVKALSTTLPVTIDGRRTKLFKGEIVVDRLVNAAVGGEHKSVIDVIERWIDIDHADDLAAQVQDVDPHRKANDNKILTAFAVTLLNNQSTESHDVA